MQSRVALGWLRQHGREAIRLLAVVVGFAAVVWGSDRHGVPESLPDVALDWTLLFHVERAAALLGAIGIVLLIGWRAANGQFPLKFGQVEYAAEEAAAQAEAVAASQEQRLRTLEVLAGLRDPGELGEGEQN